MLAEPVRVFNILCTFTKFDAVYAMTDLTKQAMPTMPTIRPTPKMKMKAVPITSEFTVDNVTNIRAALPPSPWTAPVNADLCKYV